VVDHGGEDGWRWRRIRRPDCIFELDVPRPISKRRGPFYYEIACAQRRAGVSISGAESVAVVHLRSGKNIIFENVDVFAGACVQGLPESSRTSCETGSILRVNRQSDDESLAAAGMGAAAVCSL